MDDYFDVSVCNPPFHASLAGGLSSNQKVIHKTRQDAKALNFGGKGSELWCEGGERAFLHTMMQENQEFGSQCRWFTTLISKSEYVESAKTLLRKLETVHVKEIEMKQGNKITRILAWTFMKTN